MNNISIDPDFFSKVEQVHNFVIYGDTDSLYLKIPEKIDDIQKAVESSNRISNEINSIIKTFMDNYYLPRSGIDPKYNFTEFKTELVCDAILLLDIKKNYAYRILAKEGNIFKQPKVKYTGIPIVRTDYSQFTKDMIKHVIEEIAFKNATLENIVSYLKRCYDDLERLVKEMDFLYIGIPTKWGIRDYKKDTTQILAMKLYNTLVNKDIFKPLVSGRRLPINIKDQNKLLDILYSNRKKHALFLSEFDISKLTFICFPLTETSENAKEILSNSGIEVDIDKLWNILYSKVCKRVFEVIKNNTNQ